MLGLMTAKQHGRVMLGIPRRYSHFVFGVIQSGLTSLIAAGIASFPAGTAMVFLTHWIVSWLIAWVAMLPIVLLAAPGDPRLLAAADAGRGGLANRPAGMKKPRLGRAKRGRRLLEAEVLGCNTIAR
ncbi:hypothetical protein ACVWWP_003664 [Bradyrhizobium sp. LM3.6]